MTRRAIAPQVGPQRRFVGSGEGLQSWKRVKGKRRGTQAGFDGFAVAGGQAMYRAFDLDECVADSALKRKKAFVRRLTQKPQAPERGNALRNAWLRVDPGGGERV
jgi:hypothetical protein